MNIFSKSLFRALFLSVVPGAVLIMGISLLVLSGCDNEENISADTDSVGDPSSGSTGGAGGGASDAGGSSDGGGTGGQGGQGGSSNSTALVIDHTSIDLFDQIPGQYLTQARNTTMLFRHASVGDNIRIGLDCLAGAFTGNMYNNLCTLPQGTPDDPVTPSSDYDHSAWTFEFHQPPPGQNPGWWNKLNFFVNRVNNPEAGENFDIVGFKFGYVDGFPGSNIDEKFFNNDPNDNYPSVEDLEALRAAHPGKIVLLWTMGLARSIGTPDSSSFNQQMRAYAAAHNQPLMDFADIGSHLPDGTPCYDIQDGAPSNGLEALCDEYTEEVYAGHLNNWGRIRAARAVWVLMARLAGWQP